MNSKFFPSGMGLFGRFLNEMLVVGHKASKHLTLLVFCLCAIFNHSWAQTYQCGGFQQLPVTGPPKYIDRFGNLYGEPDLEPNPYIVINDCPAAGDFDVRFVANAAYPFSQDEMNTICDVFGYLSDLIDAPSGRKAIVEVSKNPLLANNIAGQGTGYLPNQCGLGHSLIHRVLATNEPPADPKRHGIIEINPTALLYTGPPQNIPSGYLDLYTVVLHEALHIMGFGSQINIDGKPVRGAYSLWDLNLKNPQGEFMIADNTVAAGSCCRDYSFNHADFPGMPDIVWNQNCGDLVFNVESEPPVNAHYAAHTQENFLNTLSHFDNMCGGPHVMNFEIASGQAGVRRLLAASEIETLCRLGYKIVGGCDADCFVMATNDGPIVKHASIVYLEASSV